MGSEETAHAILVDVHRELRDRHPNRTREINELSDPDIMARTVRNTRARAVLRISSKVMTLFRARGIRIIRARAAGKSFVIGSRPVMQMGFGSNLTLYNFATEMWMPIAHDVIVGVGGGAQIELLHFDDGAPIRKFNEAILRQSSAFGCRSPQLATSLSTHVWSSL